jgi:hypothetical protein
MDAFACEMTSAFNKETVNREPLIATGAPLKPAIAEVLVVMIDLTRCNGLRLSGFGRDPVLHRPFVGAYGRA